MNQQEFSEWVNSRWDGYDNRSSLTNLAIMGLGLGGETGEVAEEAAKYEQDPHTDTTELKLELGDVLHYATAIGGTFKVPTVATPPNDPYPDLIVHVGQVLEPVKKFIRDGKDPAPKLAIAIPHVIATVEFIAQMYNIDPDDVRRDNVKKLMARQAKGTFVHTHKIYLAGPMQGYPEFNFPAFKEAAFKLRYFGHTVFSPAEKDIERHAGVDISKGNASGSLTVAVTEHKFSLRDALRDDMVWICEHATAIAMLPGWENSKGAQAEWALARALGLVIFYLSVDDGSIALPSHADLTVPTSVEEELRNAA